MTASLGVERHQPGHPKLDRFLHQPAESVFVAAPD